ncbi:MAG: peptidyl-prolyl cis-trans isomerase [Deltaproteobacteria bacterium]|nr:peptidyl-prolyl cis-trans isomerase [Deltaproteobacteria bacterium]
MGKKTIPFFLFLLLAGIIGCRGAGEKTELVVAKVGERSITLKEYEDALARFLPDGAAGAGSSDGKTAAPADDKAVMKEIKRDLISQLVEEALILQEAERMGITVTPEELTAQVEGIEKDYGGAAFKDVIKERYGDVSKWKEEIRKKFLIKKTVDKIAASRNTPSEEDARRYYDGHIKEFDFNEQVRARMIVVNSDDDARRIRKGLTALNFAETASRTSLSPEAKNGGDLGFFGRGDMPKEFEDVVFNLAPGEISPVVKTPYGYHLFLVVERKKGGRLPWAEAKGKITERLRVEKSDAVFAEWLDSLKRKTNIEVNEALL